MNLYRCRICGDTYLGAEKPTNCPFCGAHQKLLVTAADYEPTVAGDLSRKTRENLQRVLELQVDNSSFLRGASKVADSEEGRALFSALAKVEAEHASVICRVLGVVKPEELYDIGECSPSHKENLAESHRREERAINLYRRLAEEEKDERVLQVLEAFVEVENDHLALSK